MVKFCLSCGKALDESVKFCTGCGANADLNTQTATQQPPIQQQSQPQTNYQPPVQQQYPPAQQQYMTQPIPPQKKTNGKIIAVLLIVVIVAIILVAILFFFAFQDGDSDSNNASDASSLLVGRWDIKPSAGYVYNFKDDNTLWLESEYSITGQNIGTWAFKNGKLCLTISYGYIESGVQEECLNCDFSEGNTVLSLSGGTTFPDMTFSKKADASGDGDGDDEEPSGDATNFYGSWENTSSYSEYSTTSQIWTFYSNGSVKMETFYTYSYVEDGDSTYTYWGNFNINNNELCIATIYDGVTSSYPTCYDFSFSNNYNTLTITYFSEDLYVFTKV